MSALAIAKTCPCGHTATVSGDYANVNGLQRVMMDEFAHECRLKTLSTPIAAQTSVKAPPPLYKPTDGPPWVLASALYYHWARVNGTPAKQYSWDQLDRKARSVWVQMAEAAIDIIADGGDPYAYLEPSSKAT